LEDLSHRASIIRYREAYTTTTTTTTTSSP